MSLREILIDIVYAGVFVLFIYLGIQEFRQWLRDRANAAIAAQASGRLIRRLAVGVLVLTVMALMRFPANDSLTPRMLGLKMLVCLTLCFLLFCLALWDMREVRRQMKREVDLFLAYSTRELEELLREHHARTEQESQSTPPRG